MIKANNDWDKFLSEEYKKEYYQKLREFLKNEYTNHTIYPPMNDIFNAYKLTPLSKVKVIIIGQDPYHGKGQSMGLAFSVNDGVKIPPSLKNIYKEISDDVGSEIPISGNLIRWTEQGVFLLNAILTVRESEPTSHANMGWEIFTDNTISYLDSNDSPKVFMLWGNYAKSKKELIKNPNHLILETGHPSPFSAKYFFGCKHFSKANEFFKNNGMDEIIW